MESFLCVISFLILNIAIKKLIIMLNIRKDIPPKSKFIGKNSFKSPPPINPKRQDIKNTE